MTDTQTAAPALRNFDPLDSVALAESLVLENQDLIDRAAELKKVAEEWIAAGAIQDETEAEDLAAFLKQINNLVGDKGTANVRRTTMKTPYDTCAGVVQRFFIDQVKNVLDTTGDKKSLRNQLLGLANGWLTKKRLDDEKKKAEEAAAARAALESAKTAEEVKAASKQLQEAVAPPKAGKVKSDFGAGIHQTSRWDFDVIDITKVPQKFLVVDRTAVMAYIKTGTEKDPVKIEGITVKRVTGAVGT